MDGHYVIFGGERTQLKPDARAGFPVSYEMRVTSPEKPGIYLLRVTLVQETIQWFDQAPTSLYYDLRIAHPDDLRDIVGQNFLQHLGQHVLMGTPHHLCELKALFQRPTFRRTPSYFPATMMLVSPPLVVLIARPEN
jgi:hypothetical protein